MRKTADHDPDIIKPILREVDGAWDGNRLLDCKVAYALGMDWVNPRWTEGAASWREHVEKHGYEAAWASDHVYSDPDGGVPAFTTDLSTAFSAVHSFLRFVDYTSILSDPSGVGVEIGTYFLSHPDGPRIGNYARTVDATIPLGLICCLLRVILNELLDKSDFKIDGETFWEYRERNREEDVASVQA